MKPISRRRFWSVCLGIVCLVSLVGCVSESRYETVATELNGLRAELFRAQEEIRTLEQQRDALQKMNLDGERLLTAIRAELQQARAGYAAYQAELQRLDTLKAKARALQIEHAKRVQNVKTAKRQELKMQALVDRYEKEMRQVPEVGDMLRISQAAEPNEDHVATVTPLSPDRSDSMHPSKAQLAATSSAMASSPATQATPVGMTTPSSITPTAAPAPSAQSPAVSPQPVSPTPKPQPAPTEESWLGSLTGWLSSLWGWLFS